MASFSKHSNTQNVNYTEGLLVDYRWFDQHNIQPIYEFGFGKFLLLTISTSN